ncbi:hypothetical protein [Streptomyces sp. A1136]|uniref:hypothetical protein n=1 Tax=Streptomyces sp. A1136 TaxID=2563102 RepID=UPI00144732B9|nr:hypothetical protein [Streptomyces sp. A1136]
MESTLGGRTLCRPPSRDQIAAVGDADPVPVSLPVGTITVDKPIVTNWHTSPQDAVPFA